MNSIIFRNYNPDNHLMDKETLAALKIKQLLWKAKRYQNAKELMTTEVTQKEEICQNNGNNETPQDEPKVINIMKKKITGILSFISAVCWLVFILVMEIKDPITDITIKTVITFVSILILLISTLLYVKWTNFGNINSKEIERIEYENQLLKKKIEQKELKKALGDL